MDRDVNGMSSSFFLSQVTTKDIGEWLKGASQVHRRTMKMFLF